MGYLPIFVEVAGQPCVVIGGGEPAAAKVRILLEAGALVTIVSPAISSGIMSAVECGKVRHVLREFGPGDLRGCRLAFIATADRETAHHAAAQARAMGIPVNVADDRELSSFISPAVFKRGDLQVAISTGGSSPAVARLLKGYLQQQVGPEYGFVIEIMRRARQYLRSHEPDRERRATTLNSLAAWLMATVATRDDAELDAALRAHLDCGMAQLGIDSAHQRAQTVPGSGSRTD